MSSTAAARKHLPSGGKVPEKVRIREERWWLGKPEGQKEKPFP